MKHMIRKWVGICLSGLSIGFVAIAWRGYLDWLTIYGKVPDLFLTQTAQYNMLLMCSIFELSTIVCAVLAFCCFLFSID